MSKRAKRRHDTYKKYKKRIKERIGWFDHYQSQRPSTWTELKDKWWSKHLKDTPTPCSCPACSGESYDRSKQKKFDRHIVEEELDDNDFNDINYWDGEDYYDEWNEYYYNDWNKYYREAS